MMAPPCMMPNRLLNSSRAFNSAVTRSGETCVILMSRNWAKAGWLCARSSIELLQPFRSDGEVVLREIVAGVQRLVGQLGSAFGEQSGEVLARGGRHERVGSAGDHQHRLAGKIGKTSRLERQHGPQQDRATERVRLREQERCRDIRAVGEAERDQGLKLVCRPCASDEGRKL